MAAPAPKVKPKGSIHVTACVHRTIITKHTNICSTAIIWKKLKAILQLFLTLFKWDKKTFHPTTLYGQLYKKDIKRHILLSTCTFYVSLVSKTAQFLCGNTLNQTQNILCVQLVLIVHYYLSIPHDHRAFNTANTKATLYIQT